MDYEAANAGISPVKTRYDCRERDTLMTNAVIGFPPGAGGRRASAGRPSPEGGLKMNWVRVRRRTRR